MKRSSAQTVAELKKPFELATKSATTSGGMTFLFLVPSPFRRTLELIKSLRDKHVTTMVFAPKQAKTKIRSYWISQRRMRLSQRLESLIDYLSGLIATHAAAESATLVQVSFHPVAEGSKPFEPHGGLRIIVDAYPDKYGWGIFRVDGKTGALSPYAQFVDIVRMNERLNARRRHRERARIQPENLELSFVPHPVAAGPVPVPGAHLAG